MSEVSPPYKMKNNPKFPKILVLSSKLTNTICLINLKSKTLIKKIALSDHLS